MNWAGFFQPVNELDQTAIHPALSPVLASLSGKKKRQKIMADLAPPRGKSAENKFFAGVVDTAEQFINDVVDTSDKQ